MNYNDTTKSNPERGPGNRQYPKEVHERSAHLGYAYSVARHSIGVILSGVEIPSTPQPVEQIRTAIDSRPSYLINTVVDESPATVSVISANDKGSSVNDMRAQVDDAFADVPAEVAKFMQREDINA